MAETPLFDLGKSLATAAAVEQAKASTKSTSVGFAVDAASPIKEFDVNLTSKHEGEQFAWEISAWLKQKIQKDGTSAGVTGKIEW